MKRADRPPVLRVEQLRLGDWDGAPARLRPVFAIAPEQTTNAQRVVDLATLGYLPPPVLDPTWGFGKMWTIHRPHHLVGSDLNPARAPDLVADFHALPFRDNTFASCLFDPPYRQTGDLNGWHEHRYGQRVGEPWITGLAECCRVASRFVIVKVQDQADTHHRIAWQTDDVTDEAKRLGWRKKDTLLLSNNGSQPATTVSQRHSRRNFSTFIVLVPP